MTTNAWLAVIAVLLATLVFGPWVLALAVAVGVILLIANGIEGWTARRMARRKLGR